MTREEAIAYFKDMNECTYGDVEPIQMAVRALEQEIILDKIRAEIAELDDADYDYEGYFKAVTDALQIIDKYRKEVSE